MDAYEPSTEQAPKGDKVKKRKIRASDWRKVEDFIKRELSNRQQASFRKAHESKWKEIDRQIAMEPMKKYGPNGKEIPQSWQSAFELGELSKASEVISADVIRLIFPQTRTWFEVHVKPPMTVDEQTGRQKVAVDQDMQKKADGVLRSLMAQQHIDFGLRARVKLSIKEALHHGGCVATCEWENQNKVHGGTGLESTGAPTWVPHSMWNCYPDPSPSIIPGGSLYYTGSMLITSYMPRYKVLALSGEGYMNIDPKKIPKKKNTNKDVETEDVELVTYYGDLVIERDDGDIYLPNSKCMTANAVVIYYAPNELPFPEVIYTGYERQDVRDPYFTSPIVKNSPIQKIATIMANKFIDSVDLHTTPPIVYDGNDSYMVQNGGVNLWPGAQTASKGSNKFQEVKVGDPKAAMAGLQMALAKLEEGTAVNALRSGGSDSDRKTATEVQKTAQGAEIRTVDFVGELEPSGLRPFLYMQHEMNRKYMKSYSFYCSEKGLPDFLTMTKKEIPDIAHFEIVGSKGVLGEERRAQQMSAVTAFASSNPLFAPLLKAPEILIDMYEDAGVKGAESYVNAQGPQVPPQVQQQMQQMGQMVKELQAKLQEAQSGVQFKMQELQLKKTEMDAKIAREESLLAIEKAKAAAESMGDRQAMIQKIDQSDKELRLEKERLHQEYILQLTAIENDFKAKMIEIRADSETKMAEIEAKREADKAAQKAEADAPKKTKITRTADGYEADNGKRKTKIKRTPTGYEAEG